MRAKSNIIEWAMRYRQIVILIVSILVLFGCYSLWIMPKNEFPNFTIRQGLVVGVYPGATPAEVEEQLTKPLEQFIFGFEEVKKSETVSQSRDGAVFIVVELNDNVKNKDEFWTKFKHRLAAFKGQLPSGVLHLQANDDFGDTSALLITLESEQKTYKELDGYLDELTDRLRTIDAVSNLRRFGIQNEQISVYINPDKLAAYAIDNTTLALNLFSQGFTTLSGSVSNTDFVAPIHISDIYNTETDIAEQIVYSDLSGNTIRLKDVARIVREYPVPTSYIKNNENKCVLLSMEMRKGNNIVQVGKEIKEILEQYKQELPKDVTIYNITDQSQVVGDSVASFLLELLIAIVSVVVVIMLLMPLRVASVAASTIPLTIFISLALFYALGMELNTVTLAALIVTLGMIVDNSIVIIDCYMEKIDHGMSRWYAAASSAKEFFRPILSATLAISITFFPFLITTKGMTNDFLQSFPWATLIVLFVSLLIAVMLIPYMQYFFIHKGLQQSKSKNSRKTFLDYLQSGYDKLITGCFSRPKTTIAVGVLSVLAGAILFLSLPQRLMPIAERNQFAVEIFLPKGSALEQTALVADSLQNILRKDSRVLAVTSFIGTNSPRFHTTYAPQMPGSNFAQFIVNTIDNDATEQMLDEYADLYANYFPQARVRFKQMEYNEANSPIEIRLSGADKIALIEAAEQVVAKMRSMNELSLVRTNFEEQTQGVTIRLKEDEINRLGINKTSVSINTAMRFGNGIPMTTLWERDYPIPVVLKAEGDEQTNFNDISNSYVNARGGIVSVPMRQIADIEPDWQDGQLVRRNGIPTISIIAEVKRSVNINAATVKVEKTISQMSLPQIIKIETGGAKETDSEMLSQISGALIIAVLIIFFILLFHFKKMNLALLVLATLSLCLFGSAFGIWVMGLDVCVTATLGIVSLMGIIVRNGIIMMDYAEELRCKRHETVYYAALEAAKRRMRPIFLTSAAASMGVVPMILSGSTLWAPMGCVVFFGTLISMCLIITVLPVAYWMIFKKTDKMKIQEL